MKTKKVAGASSSKVTEVREQDAPTTLVPSLRFPEFRDHDKWKVSALISACQMKAGKFVRATEINERPNNGLYPCYGGNGLRGYTRTFNHSGKHALIGRQGAHCGNVKLAKGKFYATEHAVVVTPKLNNSSDWLFYALTLLNLNQFATGQAQPGISIEVLNRVPIPIPLPPEQQKIADCLGSLDDLIAAHSRKLAALQDHKKGLLQQLFPAEGETIPKLRFPEFQDAEEWKRVPLGSIADIKLGKMLDRSKHTSGLLLPYLNNISVRWGSVDTDNLPQMYFNENELVRYGLEKGDVLVCEGGQPGRSAVWDGHIAAMKFQKAVHRVRFKIPFNPHLLVHFLESISGTNQFEMLFTGGGIKHLTRETFSKLSFPLPSHAEVEKIADCLSALDTLITAQTEKIAALKEHKKGLMQQLFPNTEKQNTL